MKRHDNEEAAGATLTLVSVFLLSCVLFILIGYGVDKIVAISIATQSIMPATQMRYDVIRLMLLVFRFEPLILLLGGGINVWVVSTKAMGGWAESDLAQMGIGAAELILLTLGMIALVMFGGGALETVVNVVNNVPFVSGENAELYSAVIYVGVLFYGLCFLGLVGAVVQYLILCVRSVDYGASY